jgi:hypothetical protein
MGAFSESHNESDVKKLLSGTSSIVDSGVLSENMVYDG